MHRIKKSSDLYIKKRLEGLEDENFENANWLDVMIPYADLMTLLLVFFVFFFIISGFSTKQTNRAQLQSSAQSDSLNEQVISIPSEILFETGKAELKWESIEALTKIAYEIMDRIGNENNWQIRIEGHTDNVPIKTKRYASNWDLSTARALSVVKFFMERHFFPPDQLQAMGYGKFRPIAPNNTPVNRRKNRRVEIRLSKSVQ